jgi:signal transduction histidine kinase
MIERAVDNLLRNAQRFNPPGQPIELHAQRQGERILISVRDHGPGVDAEHLSQLGEPFYRAPGQTAQGHGLGLAIARRAAERHGGSLILANHPTGGFIASIDLPLEPGVVTPV